VLRDNFQTEGYNVEVAADGAAAVKSARAIDSLTWSFSDLTIARP
jgi:DNA-binding response OmpR family regulator